MPPDELPRMSASGSVDSDDLATQGYRQELDRSLGSFSAFAAGFSYLSLLTGLFQNFHLGYSLGGPAFFWTWPLTFLGQLAIALCFAELAAHYPVCGGVYQWSRRIGTRSIGWLAGWVYLASLVVTLAAVALALQQTLPQLWPACQFVGDGSREADRATNAVILGLGVLLVSTVISSVGVRFLAAINNIGVFCELCGVLLLIALLAAHALRRPGALVETLGHGQGEPGGYFGPFCAAGVMAAYIFYGYDTAGTLAEETRQPRRRAPRAILQALLAAGVGGALVLLFALMAVSNLRDPRLSRDGLPYLVKEVLGDSVGSALLLDVVFAIVVCVLAVQAGAVRLLYAMARDGELPGACRLARVSPRTQVPTFAVFLSGGLAGGILLANLNFPKVVEAVVSVSIVWANLAYLLVVGPLLVQRLRGWPRKGGSGVPGLFRLGRWAVPINALAVLWATLTVINMAWPRAEIYGSEGPQRWSATIATLGLLAAGAVYYRWARRGTSRGEEG